MDLVRFGRQIRALRRRRGWRQVDLAAATRLSRSTISLVELGRGDRLSLATLIAVANALSARLELRLSWNGEALERLLDADHASLVELVATRLRTLGWQVAVEISFAVGGERGSIDVLGWHPPTGAVLVVEVKSVVPDIQASVSTHDRKSRLGVTIARERGWLPAGRASRLLVVADSRTSRRRIATHAVTFDAAYPTRGWDVVRWLRSPDPGRPISGLMFLAPANHPVPRQRVRIRTANAARSSRTGSVADSAERQPGQRVARTR
ncbi:MAG TPA: helix-turn-helix domain-containing protein [Candidatus Limnocylindrales bacterium]|nr:helix-turn-helix domain-containing protein [Candidatus Limnocylindrales bacterium]